MNLQAIGLNIIPKAKKPLSFIPERKNLNFQMLNGVASVKKISATKYKIRMLNDKRNITKITSMIKAFNDIEIEYTDDVITSDLIQKSKKALWSLSKSTDGTFILERVGNK